MKLAFTAVALAAASINLCLSHTAQCGIIFTNSQIDENGTGFGNVLTVLSLQTNPTEFGSVLWDGDNDVLTEDAANQSQTRTVAELIDAGIDESNLTVVFNISEGGGPPPVLTLHDFDLVFQDAAGVVLFRETFDAGPGLPLGNAGTGNGASGWRFDVVFTNAAAAVLYFDAPTNRLGMEITSDQAIENTKGAADSFYVTAPIIPEPTNIVNLLLAITWITAVWSRRRW